MTDKEKSRDIRTLIDQFRTNDHWAVSLARDLLWVVGTISQRQAPVLRRIYEQMMAPRWVMAFGTCASCGGFYDNYTTVPGIDKIIPTDVYVPGCPPRPEAVFDGLLLIQDKIACGVREPSVVKPRADPVAGLVQIRDTKVKA